jgi:RNA polymerase sigma-70 factor (ECF subfamily)
VDPETDQRERYRRVTAAHGDAIARLARSLEADPQRRIELVQEIHLQLWRSLARFDGRCSERTWVFRVAHNVAASHVDAERRAGRTCPLDGDPPDPTLPSDVIERRQAVAVVQRLVRGLPPLDRQVVLLYLEGLEAAEIGEITGASANAVAIRLHRVKALLARRFQEKGP